MRRLIVLLLLAPSLALAQSTGTLNLAGPSTNPADPKISVAAAVAAINTALAAKTDWPIVLSSPPPIGSVAPSTGAFTTVNVSGALTGAGFTSSVAAVPMPAASMPALTGDVTTSIGTVATTLITTAVTPGSYTSANLTIDAKGRITAATNGGGGAPSGAAGGGLAGTYPNPSVAAVPATALPALTGDVTSSVGTAATTLATTAVAAGSYTNTNLTVDAKGRLTAAANGTVPVVLSGAHVWTGQNSVTPTTLSISTATFTPDGSSNNYAMTLVHASCPCTLANPSATPVAGTGGQIVIKQSATGSDTISSWGSQYIAAGGTSTLTLSVGANATDILSYYVVDSTHVALSLLTNFSH